MYSDTEDGVERERLDGPREDRELYSGEPSGFGNHALCHDILGSFDWMKY